MRDKKDEKRGGLVWPYPYWKRGKNIVARDKKFEEVTRYDNNHPEYKKSDIINNSIPIKPGRELTG